VTLSTNHRIATVTLSGQAEDGDVITAGDFHTIDMQCFDYPDAAVRFEGSWTTNFS